jgi:RHS repeat-associated protein
MRTSRVFVMLVSLLAGLLVAFLGAPPASATPVLGALAGAGERPGATRLTFYAGDSVRAQVDVGSGNLLVGVRSLTLPSVNGRLQLGASYNSAVASADPNPLRLGVRGWGLDYTDDVRIVPETTTPATSAVTYRGPRGIAGVFTPIAGSANPIRYTAPAGFKSTLTRDASGYLLVANNSQQARTFNANGLLTAVKDRNGNTTSIVTSGTNGSTVTIRTAAGALEASTAVISKPTTTKTVIKQGSATTLRSVSFENLSSTVTRFTDALGRGTNFVYYDATSPHAGLLGRIDAPGNLTTSFSYDSQNRLYSVNHFDQALGQNNTTRFQYTTVGGAATTYVADPSTNQASSPGVVPHTTYTLDSTQRVTKVVDPMGRERATTFTPNYDVATSTLGTGGTSNVTTNTYGANNGQSLTQTTSGSGASRSRVYATASGPAQYLPTGGSDDAGNASTYTYNGPGNQLTSTDAGANQAAVSYNLDGTVATATSPGNGTNATSYGYTSKQLTSVTPVTGSSLGTRAFTYDAMGRVKTATNGRGITRTWTYDDLDRVTKVAFSDGTQVTYGYDSGGRLNSRVDVNGTTTWTYDEQARLKSRSNTFGGGTVAYAYDKANRLTSSTSVNGGTVTYGYDLSGLPTTITYPAQGGGTAVYTMAYDDQGRQTTARLGSTNGGNNYAASATYSYSRSGRVARVTANTGPGTANVVDLEYCYVAGTTAAGGCTASSANDRGKLQWRRDHTQYETSTFTYDTQGRVKKQQGFYDGNIPASTYQYGYDANGNRTTATPAPNSDTGSQTLAFNPANQISTSGYTYDGAGNLTADPASSSTNIGYTAADQVRSGTNGNGTWTVKHAGTTNNELLEQNSVDGKYTYTYGRTNSSGLPVVEQMTRVVVQNGTTNTYNTSFVNNPLTGEPLIQRLSNGTQNMYVYNGTPGAPIALLTSGGGVGMAQRYDPYGVPIVTQGYASEVHNENPYTFSGAGVYMRQTGWIHYGARYYSTVTGTFTQQDTLNAPLDPLNGNRYAFAGGDPVNNLDPTGQGPLDWLDRATDGLTVIEAAKAVAEGDSDAFAVLAGGYIGGVGGTGVCIAVATSNGFPVGPGCALAGGIGAEIGARIVDTWQSGA